MLIGNGLFGRSGVAIVSCAASLVLAQAALAQGSAHYSVVTADKTALRCFNTDTSYLVAELAPGTVVKVESEGPVWAKVAYPPKVTAFVRAEDAKVDGKTLKLTQPSKLKAASTVAGFAGSWKALLETPLPVGAELKLIESVNGKDGALEGYRVEAPEGARGYVEVKALRPATDAEIAGTGAKPDAAKPADAAKPQTPTPADSGKSLLEPTTPVGTTPRATANPAIPGTPAQPDAAKPVDGGAKEPERKVGSVEALEAAFIEVRKQPIMTAEIDEMMAEFQRAIDATPADATRRKAGLQQRLELLKVQQEYRETLRKMEAARAKVDAGQDALAKEIQDIERTRVYSIVGSLQPSTVYDGTRLPLMFRIQSVGGTSPRTLGYLKPSTEFELEKKTGLVIGVVGQAQMDRSLKLNIITPVRVDVLKAAPANPTTTPATPAAPTAAKPKAAEGSKTTDAQPKSDGGQ